MKVNFNSYCANNLNYKARPLAKYCYLHNRSRDIIIYQLEKTDIDFLELISKKIKSFYRHYGIKDESTQQVLKEAVDAGIEILAEKNVKEEKAKVLLAISDKEPSAILIGNTKKIDKMGKFHYSSRKNHSKDETELDWLATWNKKILGEGKAIVCEYFRTLLEDGFKQCYVRSEIPEKSFALEFYKKMGFAPLSNKQRKILRKNDNNYVIGNFDAPKDMIIPMKATTKDIQRSIKKRSQELMRKEFDLDYSVELPTDKI